MDQETAADEVGRAGHDLNNLCARLMGFASLAMDCAPPGSIVAGYLDEISHSAAEAAALARHLHAIAQRLREPGDP